MTDDKLIYLLSSIQTACLNHPNCDGCPMRCSKRGKCEIKNLISTLTHIPKNWDMPKIKALCLYGYDEYYSAMASLHSNCKNWGENTEKLIQNKGVN